MCQVNGVPNKNINNDLLINIYILGGIIIAIGI